MSQFSKPMKLISAPKPLLLPAPKQLLLGPPTKIVHPRLHEAVLEFGFKSKSSVPVKFVKSGGLFRRAFDSHYLGNGNTTNVIFSKPGGDANRYDGKTAKGDTAPVIYLASDTEAASAEGLHYSDRAKYHTPLQSLSELKKSAALWLPKKTVVTYMTKVDIELADFRMDSPEGMQFLKHLNRDPGVQAALKLTPYNHVLQAAQAADDYSVSRALGHVADKEVGANGSTWNTARISRNADRFSDNLTIKGEYLKPVEELRPLFAQDYYEVGGKLWYIVKKLDPTIDPDDYAHFPEGERAEVQVPGIEDEFTK